MQEGSLQLDWLLPRRASVGGRMHDVRHGLGSRAHHCHRHGDADGCTGGCAAVAGGCRLQAATSRQALPANSATLLAPIVPRPGLQEGPNHHRPGLSSGFEGTSRRPCAKGSAPKLLQRRRCRLQWRLLLLKRTQMSWQLLQLMQPPACSSMLVGMPPSRPCICPDV